MTESVDSVALYRTRKLLRELSSKTGKGTELISLYIPPKKALHEVLNNLREEYGTATNIKSDSTRNHVQDALTKTQQRLKLFKRTPDNGIVLFVGALPTNGPGSEEIFVHEIIPPKTVQTYLYRCDDHFHLEYLDQMLRDVDIIGIISIDASEAGFGMISGDDFQIEEIISSGVGGKTRAGGQSARRFERLREMNLTAFYTRVAEHAKKIFIDQHSIKGLIVGGPGPTKDYFLKSEYLDYRLDNKILSVVDTSYSGGEGVRETMEKASDSISNMRVVEEKNLIQKFLREINREKGLAVYGVKNVISYLNQTNADPIIVTDNNDNIQIVKECNKCEFKENQIVKRENIVSTKQNMISSSCTNCNSSDIHTNEIDIVDLLDGMCLDSGSKLEVISGKSEDGKMLNSFSGVAAFLRYRVE